MMADSRWTQMEWDSTTVSAGWPIAGGTSRSVGVAANSLHSNCQTSRLHFFIREQDKRQEVDAAVSSSVAIEREHTYAHLMLDKPQTSAVYFNGH